MSQIIDSDRRCPFDSKRMLLEIGQDDSDAGDGWVKMIHFCLNCDYYEQDRFWPRPKLTLVSSQTASQRLRELRLGKVIPMYIDPSPFPPSEFDEEVRSS